MITPELLKNKNILLRTDLDVPLKGGRVANDYRLQVLLPTIKLCLENAKSTLIIGHLGRPDGPDPSFSLAPVREWLEKALYQSIFFINSGYSPEKWARGDFPLAMLNNLRFDKRELENNRELANDLCQGSNIYIYEAFAAYNQATSLQIIPEVLPTYTGIQFDREVDTLTKIIKNTAKPSLLIVSGAKEDKIPFVDKFVDKFDEILIGGRLALNFSSICKPNQACLTSARLTPDSFDIDEESARLFTAKIKTARSIVLNGPLGKFEDGLHAAGTKIIFQAVKDSPAFSVIGGGDTLAAIPALGFAYTDFDFVSTGGGAMLEFLATGTHPLLEVLKKNQGQMI